MEQLDNKKINNKVDLKERIEELIESSNLSYEDVDYALNALKAAYMEKGKNLLNATNIQKVIETPRFR